MSDSPPYWFYIDDDGKFQGPFPHADMQAWLRDSYFTVTTKVCAAFSEGDPVPTDELEFEAIMNRTDFLEKTELDALKREYAEQKAREETEQLALQPSTSLAVPPATSADSTSPPLEYSGEWYYLDKTGEERGPFTASQLQEWIDAGYIENTLQIRNSVVSEFCALASLPSSPFRLALPTSEPTLGSETTHNAPTPALPSKEVLAMVGDRMWYYLDDKGCRRGPWSTHQMRYWAAKGFLTANDARLRLEGEGAYVGWRDHPAITAIVPGMVAVNKWDVRRIRKARKGGALYAWTGQCEPPSADPEQEKTEEEEEKQIQALLVRKIAPESVPGYSRVAGGSAAVSTPGGAGGGVALPAAADDSHVGTAAVDGATGVAPAIAGTGTGTGLSMGAAGAEAVGGAAVLAAVAESSTYQPSLWLYLDSAGALQGPFPEATMHAWYTSGALPPSLRVRRVSEPAFVALEHRRDCMFTLKHYLTLYERTAMQTFVRTQPQPHYAAFTHAPQGTPYPHPPPNFRPPPPPALPHGPAGTGSGGGTSTQHPGGALPPPPPAPPLRRP